MSRFCRPARGRLAALRWLLGLGLLALFSLGRADAQSLRDPTLPPIEAGPASTLPNGKSLTTEPAAMSIIVRNGRPHLVVGTRLYAQGQQLGKARIERISETEVWLRESGVLRKVPRFTGIQRHPVAAAAVAAGCAARAGPGARAGASSSASNASGSSHPSSVVAPCAGVQP